MIITQLTISNTFLSLREI